MTAIRAIQVMKRDLGLDEGAYRSLLVRVTGKDSLRAMTPVEQGKVAAELRSKGGDKREATLAGPYGGKLQALWLSGWNLGLIRNPADDALLAFVKGQTGIDHTRFLRNAADARKAVEALKSWLARGAGVVWSEHDDPQDCVLAAQRRRLGISEGWSGPGVDRHDYHPDHQAMGDCSVCGHTYQAHVDPADNVALMKELGERIRAQGVAD